MKTLLEMKRAFTRLPKPQKVQFARWLQTQVDDRLSDDEMMAIAAAGARIRPPGSYTCQTQSAVKSGRWILAATSCRFKA
jgi:hypothetical protein